MGCGQSQLATDPATGTSVFTRKAGSDAPKPVLLEKYQGDVTAEYNLGKVLGKGQFGTTRLAVRKDTGEKFACKSISKRKLAKQQDRDDVKQEIQILEHLTGHHNIVRFLAAYEDKRNVHIVMELCSGGELFDRIVARGHYSEKTAAQIIRSVVEVVQHCHSMGVIHRDLKPENFLLSDGGASADLKATDFGLSTFYKPGDTFDDIVGSAYYVAPEVLRRQYSAACDIWSCGVIAYILLCGMPPFYGDSEAAIFRAVARGKVDFESMPWPRISAEAKDVVRKMLERDVKKRATAHQILQHDWMKENGCASDVALENEIQSRMKKFNDMNKLKRAALRLIASYMAPDEVQGLRNQFERFDKDKSGTITVQELYDALAAGGSKLPRSEIDALVGQIDLNASGAIDYDEFLAATVHASQVAKDEHLQRAFKDFDADGSGSITREELIGAITSLGAAYKVEDIDDIIAKVDKNGDGKIDYEEFVCMLQPEHSEPVRRRHKIKF